MKRLYILRHALTHPAGESGDLERKLTEQGMQDSLLLGERMKDEKYIPGFILCSPATRTRQTLDNILHTLPRVEVEYEKSIYEGGYDELVRLVSGVSDNYESVLLVGHNPSIHQFAASMADEGPLVNQLASGYAPCTLSVLDVPRASWKDLQSGENKLVDLITA